MNVNPLSTLLIRKWEINTWKSNSNLKFFKKSEISLQIKICGELHLKGYGVRYKPFDLITVLCGLRKVKVWQSDNKLKLQKNFRVLGLG